MQLYLTAANAIFSLLRDMIDRYSSIDRKDGDTGISVDCTCNGCSFKLTIPDTTLVLTNLSLGHLATAAFCRQPHKYRTGRGHASGDVKIDNVIYIQL